ncbi:hypothetical protein CVT24_005806 [Panaeolus cyanescens]|uniref:Uncharacterized protein n=1 Tax=Panaeolus cyanescens TaxID=181874 RepID=A0A409VCX3_9AGAR|nr:hypothetical protein CVT24_005806 [Panaeolus cyanescens]
MLRFTTPRKPPCCRTCGQPMRGHNRLACEASPIRSFSDSPPPQSDTSAQTGSSTSVPPRSLTPTESVGSVEVEPVETGRFLMPSNDPQVRFIPSRTMIGDPSFEIPEHGPFHRINPYRNRDFFTPPIAHFDGPPTLIVGSDGEPASCISTRHSTPEPSEESNTPNSTMSSDTSNNQATASDAMSNHIVISARTRLSEAIQKFREGLRATPSTSSSLDMEPEPQDKGKMRQRSPVVKNDPNFQPVPIAALYEATPDNRRLLEEDIGINTAVVSPIRQFRDISPFKTPSGFMGSPGGEMGSESRWIVAGTNEPQVQRIAATLNQQNRVVTYVHKVYYTIFWFTLMIGACAVYDRIKASVFL